MLSAAEVEAMPDTEVLRQLLLRADRIDGRLDKLDDALGGEGGIRSQLVALRSASEGMARWSVDHDRKDDERHKETFAALQSEKAKLDKLIVEAEDDSEEDRRERRKAWSAMIDPRILIPILMALGAGAAGGYGGGAYYPPHEVLQQLEAAPVPRRPAPAPPPVPPGEVTE